MGSRKWRIWHRINATGIPGMVAGDPRMTAAQQAQRAAVHTEAGRQAAPGEKSQGPDVLGQVGIVCVALTRVRGKNQ